MLAVAARHLLGFDYRARPLARPLASGAVADVIGEERLLEARVAFAAAADTRGDNQLVTRADVQPLGILRAFRA